MSVAAPVAAGPIYLGPSAYLSETDSPFAGGSFSYFHLENFEDGLNAPGASAAGGFVIGTDQFVDSVEGGTAGHSWYSGMTETTLTFLFDEAVLGNLPTHVGLVWTDIGWNAPISYYGPVTFEAFDPWGLSLGIFGPYGLGDGFDTGQKAEDRFFGAVHAGGISKIRMSTNNVDWEVDHLQYGLEAPTPVPEPGTLTLVGLGAAALARVRQRRRSRH